MSSPTHLRGCTAAVLCAYCRALVLASLVSVALLPRAALAGAAAIDRARTTEISWRAIQPGIELAEVRAPQTSRYGDSTFVVTRIDAKKNEVNLFSPYLDEATARAFNADEGAFTAVGWAKREQLTVTTNAGMFESGTHLPVGHAKGGGRTLQGKWRKDYRAVLVADPTDPSLPAVQILDGECDAKVDEVAKRYRFALQGIRMVSCAQRNTWQKDAKEWSVVVAAVDGSGRLLFIHSRSPYTMSAFIAQVQALPLDVKRMVYLEGGPEASLVVGADPARADVRFGSYETGFNENDDNGHPWVLPNVVGVRAR